MSLVASSDMLGGSETEKAMQPHEQTTPPELTPRKVFEKPHLERARSKIFHESGDFWLPDLPYRVFNPKNKYVEHWGCFILAVAFYSSFIAPLYYAFLSGDYGKNVGLEVVNHLVDLVFLVDIVMRFRLPYIHFGDLVTEPENITKNYLRMAFWMDLLATIPYELINSDGVRFLQLLRLLRINRILQMFRRMELDYTFNYVMVSSFKLLGILFGAGHVSACVFWRLGINDVEESWIAAVDTFDLADAPLGTKYTWAIYWSFTTLTTVGYGDILPVTVREKVFVSVAFLVNMAISAYVLATLTLLAIKTDESISSYRTQMANLDDLLTRKDVPGTLKKTALAQLQLSFDRRYDLDDALEACPPFMRRQLMRHLYRPHVEDFFLFKKCSSAFIDAITAATYVVFVHSGTLIMSEGELFDSIVYIFEGTVGISHKGKQVGTFGPGETFGQIPVVCELSSSLTAIATSYCRVLFYPKDVYDELIARWPEDGKQARKNVLDQFTSFSLQRDKNGDVKIIQPFGGMVESMKVAVASMDAAIASEPTDEGTKLCHAAHAGDAALVRRLCEAGANPNTPNFDGRRAMHLAAATGSLQVMQVLLEFKANAEVVDRWGHTPLDDAKHARHENIVSFLQKQITCVDNIASL